MSIREQARDVIAALVVTGRYVPKMHPEFDDYSYRAKVWREEYDACKLLIREGKIVQWAEKRQPRMVKESEQKNISIAKKDHAFYLQAWSHHADSRGMCRCEECGEWLRYSASHVSHNLSRGAHPGLRHHMDNITILCLMHHQQWEDSHKRKRMRIYLKKLEVMERLKREHYGGEKDR
jgi:hypothetical protein